MAHPRITSKLFIIDQSTQQLKRTRLDYTIQTNAANFEVNFFWATNGRLFWNQTMEDINPLNFRLVKWVYQHPWNGGGGGGGGFFLSCEDLGKMFGHSFTPVLFFYVEISSRTLIPLFRHGLVHSSSASGDNCGRVFPDELRVNSFPVRFPR